MPDKLLAGEIGKPHGTAGDVYVVRISDDPQRFDPGSRLIHGDGRTLVVESARVHRDRFLVKFEGIDSRAEAEGLRGALYVDADERRELGESEYWADDLIGCTVMTVSGAKVGTARDVMSGAAHDLLVVDTENGDRLVPMVKEIVTQVDLDARSIVVDPPEGLLE